MKKRICMILTVMLSVFLFAVAASAADTGDVDGNGKVTAMDARMALRAAASIDKLNTEQAAAADVDGNGKVTAMDARMILRVAANIDKFYGNGDTNDPSITEKPESSLSAKDIHNIAINYTVEVYAYLDGEYMSAGSGFFISGDGTVVTNYHVIDGAYEIYVVDCNGDMYAVTEILGYDSNIDLAVIQVDAVSVPATISNATPETGDTIYTLGNSAGEYYDTFTNGIISNASRVVAGYNPNMTYIQHTAPITHGNSGGPLINDKGEVIGINTWGDTSGQNLNFAVPVSYLNEIDTGNPLTMEEFAGGLYLPSDAYVVASYDEIILRPGGTACLFFMTQCDLSDYSLTYETSNNNAVIEWGDWYDFDEDGYNDTCALFISSEYYCSNNVLNIYITEAPEISTSVIFSVSDYGESNYVGDEYCPDFGAYVGTSPIAFEMTDDLSVTTYTYSSADMYCNGTTDHDFELFFDAILANGFELFDYKETYDFGMLEYINYEYGVGLVYTETYDYTGEYIDYVFIDIIYA